MTRIYTPIFSRRRFLKVGGVMGSGLVIGVNLFSLPEGAAEDATQKYEINAFIKIMPDGSACLAAKNPEVGQGVRTSLPMILAEELDLPWEKIQVLDTKLEDRLGPQLAGGSQSIRTNYALLRKAGAAAKVMLVRAAAKRWGVTERDCVVKDGIVLYDKEKLHYGLVAEDASRLPLPQNPKLKNPANFSIIGKPVVDVDMEKIVTGQSLFGIDQHIDGMLYACILKPSVFGSRVVEIDDSKAKQTPGVFEILKIIGRDNPTELREGVAVIAANTWAAMQGKKYLKVAWEPPKDAVFSTDELQQLLRDSAQKGEVLREDGDIDNSFLKAEVGEIFEAEYRVPLIAHAQMEPMNFIADVSDDGVRLIGSTQLPAIARKQASIITGIKEENISVEVSRGGGGFGRRLYSDCVNEAVYLSQKMSRPIQVVADRESDFLSSYFRPASLYQFKARLRKGKIRAFDVKSSSTSRKLYAQSDEPAHSTEVFPDQHPAGMVQHFRIRYQPVLTNIPQGALRTPGVNSTTFAYQCFIDELAEQLAKDPIDFQLNVIGSENRDLPYRDHGGPSYNTAKLRHVIEKVRELSGWTGMRPKNSFMGFAAQMVFGCYVAQVASISVRDSRIKVDKVVCVIDCGRVINPSGALAQVQGGITDAVSAALFESISISEGKLVEKNFDRYQKLRMPDSPAVDVHFVPSDADPQGLGEASYPLLFPALCNAIYAATGRRIRELPITNHVLI